ncbi:arylamine N-acetyltransferase family protein [Pseudaquabacterium terrae]|nr:arylamine N-acetyltransferase [Aquabacterium terrae]
MSDFSLDHYLHRIGYSGERTNTLPVLAALQRAHAQAIAFEDLDPWLGRPLSLDAASVERKLVHEGRGGFCFEQNLLFATALRALGFTVLDLAARVGWNLPENATRPRTHRVLLVTIGVTRYLADVGFGGHTLTAPLRLDRRSPQSTPHGPARVQYTDGLYTTQVEIGGEWRELYRFDLQPQLAVDYEMACWYVCHHPASIFRTQLIAARALPDGRLALRDRTLTFYGLDGRVDSQELGTAAELREALQKRFGLSLDGVDGLDAALARCAAGPPG